MGWLDQVVDSVSGKPKDANSAYASYWPAYEQQTPQYPYPNPYNLAVQGYRRNELIYACTNKRAKAVAEAPIRVDDTAGDKPEELKQHKLRLLMRTPIRVIENGQPVFTMTEKSFWRITETFLCVAGFSAWEIEQNMLGEPLNLWPMRPDWCSFKRGDRNPLAKIRYQPFGLPPQDVPMSRVLLFQYFDPIFPLLKALSPTAVANRSLSVDNATTDFLQIFFARGAVINGLLSTDQSLQEADAFRIRMLWRQQHGGIENWGDPAVLGQGMKYQPMQMDFRAMQFGDVDARAEAHICEAFEMPPILVGAKVGLDRSTFSNYKEARSAWYEEWTMPEWDWLDSEIEAQLLPKFESQPERYVAHFDLSRVKALQEDEDARHERAREDAKSNLVTRDEAREMLGLTPIDNGSQTFIGQAAPAIGEEPSTAEERADRQEAIFGGKENDTEDEDEDEEEEAAKELERKQYRAWLKRGAKVKKPFVFKHLSEDEQKSLKEAYPAKRSSPFKNIDYGSDSHRSHMERFEKRANKYEERVKVAAKKLFEDQKADILLGLQSQKATPDPFDLEKWIAEFKRVVKPILVAAIKESGQLALNDINVGLDFNVDDPNVVKFLKKREQKFAVKINEDTWSELKEAFAVAIEDGEGLPGMMKTVENIMGSKIRSSPEVIARTEVISSLNRGTRESWSQSGVVGKKRWLSTLDNRTRGGPDNPDSEFDHYHAHGETVGLDEPFMRTGEPLDHPGDPSGSAGNIIQCRCSMVAVVD